MTFSPVTDDDRVVVLIPGGPGGSDNAKKAEAALKAAGHTNFRCYLEGMEKWREASGDHIEFPRFIKFKVTFLKLKQYFFYN